MGMTQRKGLVFMVAMNIVLVVMATSVVAEEGRKNNSIQVKLGLFDPTGDADDRGFQTGSDITESYNRYFSDWLVLEGGLSLYGTSADSKDYNDSSGSYSRQDWMGGVATLLTLKGEYSLGPVDLFGGAGIGMYLVTLTSEVKSTGNFSYDKDTSDSVFGAHLVAGANYNINERFYIGLEGSYRWTDDVEVNEMAGTIPVNFEGDLSGYTVSMTGGFRF